MAAIRVLLADDRQVVRDSLRAYIGINPDIEVVAEATDVTEALRLVGLLRPDVLVLDTAMPSSEGGEILRRLRQDHPECAVLVLSQHKTPDHVLPALQAGARGYLLTPTSAQELVQAVRALARGDCFLHPMIARVVLDAMRVGETSDSAGAHRRLTKREREVLSFVGEGFSNAAVGSARDRSEDSRQALRQHDGEAGDRHPLRPDPLPLRK